MLKFQAVQRVGEAKAGLARLQLVAGGIIWASLSLLQPPLAVWILALGPTVIVPLGLTLIRRRLENTLERSALEIGRWLSVPAAASFVGGFWFKQGPLAASLVLPWFLTALVLGLAGVSLFWKRGWRLEAESAFAAALLFLPVGAGWAVLSRAGLQPQQFSHEIVLLTGVHFHYAGFALPILTGHAIGNRSGAVQRGLVAAVVVGVPMVGVGISLSPLVEVVSAIVLAAGCLAVAWFQVRAAFHGRNVNQAMLLLVSSASVTAAMILAGVYAVGEFTGGAWLSIPAMSQTHGVLNAFGFALCGLVARVTSDAADAAA